MKPAAFQIDQRGRWKRPGTMWQRIRARYRVNKRTGCHEWTAHRSPKGYALMWWDGETRRVSRLIWTKRRGRIPAGKQILHRCDNPRCIRLAHLFVGSNRDNMLDRDRKQRQARGERSGGAKLTAQQVKRIRKAVGTSVALAPMFNVSVSTVCRVRSGATWRHI